MLCPPETIGVRLESGQATTSKESAMNRSLYSSFRLLANCLILTLVAGVASAGDKKSANNKNGNGLTGNSAGKKGIPVPATKVGVPMTKLDPKALDALKK